MVALTERILLVGGTGFLGSFVADRLADRALAVLARPSSDLSVLPPGVEVRFGCLEDAELPEFPAQNADAVTMVVAAYAKGFALTKSRADARRLLEQGSVQHLRRGHLDGREPQSLHQQPGALDGERRAEELRAVLASQSPGG